MTFLIRSLMKVLVLPLVLFLAVLQVFVKIGIHLSSMVISLFTLFVFFCVVLTIVRQQWSQTFLLFLIEAGVLTAAFAAGILDAVLEGAAGRLADFMRT